MASKIIKKVSSRTKYLTRKSKYNLTKKPKDKLQICQNKLIRTVLKLPPCTHLDYSHFSQLNWLPVENRVSQLKLGHIHQIIHGSAPSSYCFTTVSNAHIIGTMLARLRLLFLGIGV